jgi:hypothetical protein
MSTNVSWRVSEQLAHAPTTMQWLVYRSASFELGQGPRLYRQRFFVAFLRASWRTRKPRNEARPLSIALRNRATVSCSYWQPRCISQINKWRMYFRPREFRVRHWLYIVYQRYGPKWTKCSGFVSIKVLIPNSSNTCWLNFEMQHANGRTDELLASPLQKKKNSVAVVRKRTTPTERPPLVGEVSANLWG